MKVKPKWVLVTLAAALTLLPAACDKNTENRLKAENAPAVTEAVSVTTAGTGACGTEGQTEPVLSTDLTTLMSSGNTLPSETGTTAPEAPTELPAAAEETAEATTQPASTAHTESTAGNPPVSTESTTEAGTSAATEPPLTEASRTSVPGTAEPEASKTTSGTGDSGICLPVLTI